MATIQCSLILFYAFDFPSIEENEAKYVTVNETLALLVSGNQIGHERGNPCQPISLTMNLWCLDWIVPRANILMTRSSTTHIE